MVLFRFSHVAKSKICDCEQVRILRFLGGKASIRRLHPFAVDTWHQHKYAEVQSNPTIDPFERVDAGWARWVFARKTEHDAGGPHDDIDGCAEIPGDLGRAAVVNEAWEASLGVG